MGALGCTRGSAFMSLGFRVGLQNASYVLKNFSESLCNPDAATKMLISLWSNPKPETLHPETLRVSHVFTASIPQK